MCPDQNLTSSFLGYRMLLQLTGPPSQDSRIFLIIKEQKKLKDHQREVTPVLSHLHWVPFLSFMLCGMEDIESVLSSHANFSVSSPDDSSEPDCVQGPFLLPLYLMGNVYLQLTRQMALLFILPVPGFSGENAYCLFHFGSCTGGLGRVAWLPHICGACGRGVLKGRPWKKNLTSDITWRPTAPLAIKTTHFSSEFPCRNKDFYHNSSFVIIFNLVSTIRPECGRLNLNISGVLLQSSCNKYLYVVNQYCLQPRP